MPAPVVFDGMRLPASYANFYIANGLVLVPTFNDPNDRVALGILAELFPDREVVGIHAVDLVWGLGTLHCMSHEEPLLIRRPLPPTCPVRAGTPPCDRSARSQSEWPSPETLVGAALAATHRHRGGPRRTVPACSASK